MPNIKLIQPQLKSELPNKIYLPDNQYNLMDYIYYIESNDSLRNGRCLMFILTEAKTSKILDDICIDIKNNNKIFILYSSQNCFYICNYNNVVIKEILSNYEKIKKIEVNIEKIYKKEI